MLIPGMAYICRTGTWFMCLSHSITTFSIWQLVIGGPSNDSKKCAYGNQLESWVYIPLLIRSPAPPTHPTPPHLQAYNLTETKSGRDQKLFKSIDSFPLLEPFSNSIW